jgi:hypothetical protein
MQAEQLHVILIVFSEDIGQEGCGCSAEGMMSSMNLLNALEAKA